MDRKELKAFLAQAKKVKNENNYIYNCVKFDGNSIEFASGFDCHVRLKTSLSFQESFTDMKQLSKAATVSKAKTVNVATSEKDVVIDGISLPNVIKDVEKYKSLLVQPELAEHDSLMLQGNFLAALEKCSLFTTTEKTRYEMNNILVDFAKSIVVATDGKTMSIVPFTGEKKDRQIVLPVQTAKNLVELLDSAKTLNIDVEKSGNRIKIWSSNLEIVARLSNSIFPPYHVVIPKMENYKNSFTIRKEDLKKVCDYLKVFEIKKGSDNEIAESTTTEISMSGNVVAFALPAKNHTILLACGNSASVSAIKINQKFLSRLLTVCDKALTIFTRSNVTPLVATEGDNMFIVMPIKPEGLEE